MPRHIEEPDTATGRTYFVGHTGRIFPRNQVC